MSATKDTSMKRIALMRHAKSDWNAGAETDHERPLNARGNREAPTVGAELAAMGFRSPLVLSSDSRRTRETWGCIESHFPGADVRFDKLLYLAGLSEAREALADAFRDGTTKPESVESVVMLGHNPGWEDIVSLLAGRTVELKTAYAAVFEARAPTATWTDMLVAGEVKLVRIVKPIDD